MKTKYNLEQISEIAKEIIPLLAHKVVILKGEMGMGKTTLVKEICTQLGVKETISSPTFSIVNEYKTETETIYHFDFYRINNIAEAIDFGVEEYIYSDNWCFMEWSSKIEELLPEEISVIELEKTENPEQRQIKVYNLWENNFEN